MALINLDFPPLWFNDNIERYLSANEIREIAQTEGIVKLLTNPRSFGYVQNPISVYYCYSKQQELEKCVAEVTNTPWGERVRFIFDPKGTSIPKALHVSPFMDMNNMWTLKSSNPKKTLTLSVNVSHPTLGCYFKAIFKAKISPHNLRNEIINMNYWKKYSLMPHRITLFIYWQALILALKGLNVYKYPSHDYKIRAKELSTHQKFKDGQFYIWSNTSFPWNY